jgi:pimeloyl-ACP methyl ester carboxylesterase
MTDIRGRTAHVNGVELQVLEAGDPTAPPVILAHGFPECAHSWRHQLPALAEAGYHVIAPDQRGYGHSSSPHDVSAYGITHLAHDLLGLLDETGHQHAVLVGHDWGAMIVWETARLHPERVRAVVGASVPFTPWPAPPTQLMKAMWGDRFFYILYFQEVGPADQELEADVTRTMRSFLWGASGEAFTGLPPEMPPMEGTGLLDVLPEPPAELPAWLSEDDLAVYVERFTASGFFGPLSYYRNLDANYELTKDLGADRISMPSFFIGGERDAVTAGRPEFIDAMAGLLPDYRGSVIIPRAGHWIQQEAPAAFNDALLGFLATL